MISALMVLGFAVAVYAINQTATTRTDDKMSCCCKGKSCPMKSEGEKSMRSNVSSAEHTKAEHSSCGESCMMKKGEKVTHSAHSGVEHAKAEHSCCGESCAMKMGEKADSASGCCSCCGESCPMREKDAKSVTAAGTSAEHTEHTAIATENGCCCACCKSGDAKAV